MKVNSKMAAVVFADGMPRREPVDEMMREGRAEPAASCEAWLGNARASTVVMNVPHHRVARLSRACEHRFGIRPFPFVRRAPGLRCSWMIQADDHPELFPRVAEAVSGAGGNLRRIEFRTFPNGHGPRLAFIDLDASLPDAASEVLVVSAIRRGNPGLAMRIYDRTSGSPIFVREFGDAGRAPFPHPAESFRFVLISEGPDRPGAVFDAVSFLRSKEAEVERVVGHAIADRFVLFAQCASSEMAYDEVQSSRLAALPHFRTQVIPLKWPAYVPAAGEVGATFLLDELDNPKASHPLWRVRNAVERFGLRFGCISLDCGPRPWFGMDMIKVEGVLRGPASVIARFKADAAGWIGEGADVRIQADSAAVFANEGEIDQPFKTIIPHSRDEWGKAFSDPE